MFVGAVLLGGGVATTAALELRAQTPVDENPGEPAVEEPKGPDCPVNSAEPSSVIPNTQLETMDQPEQRSGRKITVEQSKIHVIRCDGGAAKGHQFYIYEYTKRSGWRAIDPGKWSHALGGRDFCTKGEAINAACSTELPSTAPGTTPGTPPNAKPIDWKTNAAENADKVGQQFTYSCPAISQLPDALVWGTDVYTSDSPICVAAVHAGVLTKDGGTVTIEIRAGQSSYAGSARNGVTSSDWGSWGSSYAFVTPHAGH